MFLGFSRTSWGGVPLPVPLDFAGMPGCALHVSGEALLGVPGSGAALTLPLAIANDASLLGARFHNQALVLDPGANALGATLSNAGEARIGAR